MGCSPLGSRGSQGPPSLCPEPRCAPHVWVLLTRASTHHPASRDPPDLRDSMGLPSKPPLVHAPGCPSRSSQGMGVLWDAWASGKAAGKGTSRSAASAHTHPHPHTQRCSQITAGPNTHPHPPAQPRGDPIPQPGEMGSISCADPSRRGVNGSGMPVGGGNGNSRLE